MDPKYAAALGYKTPTEPPHPEPDADNAGGPSDDDADNKSDAEIVAEVGEMVQAGEVDPALVDLASDYTPSDDPPEPPESCHSPNVWERAVAAVDPEGDGAEEWDDPWLVTFAVYVAMGGECDLPASAEEPPGDDEVPDEDVPGDGYTE